MDTVGERDESQKVRDKVRKKGINMENKEEVRREGEMPLKHGCQDLWTWNRRDRSPEVWLSGPGNRVVHFHPNWSKGTAGIRGTRILNNGRYYWELKLSQRVFGTR